MHFMRKIQGCLLGGALTFITLFTSPAFSCTGLQLKALDGSYVNGRTVEFGVALDIAGLIVPRNMDFKGTLPDGTAGLAYKSKYGAIGANTFGEAAIVDGINEKGLSVGMFYFPGYATYATITPQNKTHALSPTEFPNWILTQFSTVDEVKAAISNVVIAPTTPKNWPGLPPFHYIVYDQSGKSIAIEPTDGQLKVYDNPIGVFTNSPTFDWQITNIANYINLSPNNTVTKTIDNMQIKQFGEGSGMHGLPGDFTPPSRFIRATIFSNTAVPVNNADQAVLQAFHILNQFDIPVGAVRTVMSNSQMIPEYTLATTVKDTRNLNYYFRTYDDQTIKVINLAKCDLNAKALKTISMKSNQPVVDVTATAALVAPVAAPAPTTTTASK